MKQLYILLVTLVITLFAVDSFAWDPPTSPAPTSWISDTSGVLSNDAHHRLDDKLKRINQSSANEIAVLILSTLDGQSIEDVGDKTSQTWGVGKKDLDNGVLIVLAMKEHKSRISTGKGVEGDLPDLKCNDILQNVVRPHMRAGDVEGALNASFDAINTSIANHKAELAVSHTANTSHGCDISGAVDSDSGYDWCLGLGGALLLGLIFWYLSRKAAQRKQDEVKLSEQRQIVSKLKETRYVPSYPVKVSYEEPVVQHLPYVVPLAVVATAVESTSHREETGNGSSNSEETSSYYKSSSSSDNNSSSNSSSSDSSDWSGGSSDSVGFGGGDSGGGGGSSDW